jgi:hypothetical protein
MGRVNGVPTMMSLILPIAITTVVSSLALRRWYNERRRRRIVEQRQEEASKAHSAAALLREREDRKRWGDIDVDGLHPLNRDEVRRLLLVAESDGVSSLSSRDRLFLDNMTLPRVRT